MKRTFWITAICCLAMSLNSHQIFARGAAGAGQPAGSGGAGGHPAGGGGGHPSGGGGGGHPAGGGGGHVSAGGVGTGQVNKGGGGVHVNNGGGGGHVNAGGAGSVRVNPGGAGHITPGGTGATFHPTTPTGPINVGHTGISGSPQIGLHPAFTNNSHPNFTGHPGAHFNPAVQGGAHVGTPQNFVGTPQHFVGNHQNHVGSPAHLNGVNHSGIGHTHFVGNTANFGNHNIQLGGNAYRPSYYNHAGVYHGYWNGNRGYGGGYGPGYGGYRGYGGYGWGSGLGYGRSGYGYGYRPYFWGLGGWGLGSLMYGSGYLGYSNPYYQNSFAGSGYNYALPIPVSYNSPVAGGDPTIPVGDDSNQAEDVLNSAVAAFKQNDYDTALDITNRGISQYPSDAVLHEFRALVLFAKGDYQQAAATIHSVLAVGPGWDWTTLSGLYADVNIYTAQIRALENSVKQSPEDGATRFLLAYHYLTGGFADSAARQLQHVVRLMPSDQVAADMLKMASAPQAPTSNDPSAQPLTPQSAPTDPGPLDLPPPSALPRSNPIDVSTIVGMWGASREDGSNFTMALNPDKTFSWSFIPKGQEPQSFDGTYKLDGNVIALERTGGGSLVAEIAGNDGMRFNFKMVGAPKEDPGLDFRK